MCEGCCGESCVARETRCSRPDAVVMANIVLCEVRALSEERIFVIGTCRNQSQVRSEAEETAEHRA